MKIYYGSGFEEFTSEEFLEHIISSNLKVEFGIIKSIKILERKFLSNKGNALDGVIECENKAYATGLNIGRNPIGTGYQNYIPFLEEMNCSKTLGIYNLNSLIEKPIIYLTRNDITKGYVTSKGLAEIYRPSNNPKK